MRKGWLLAGSILVTSMLIAPQGVLANIPDRVEHDTRVTTGTSGNQSGHWIDVYESLFRWIPTPPLATALPGFPLSDADAQKLANAGITPEQLKALASPYVPGESSYPPGFWERNPAVLSNLFQNGAFGNRTNFVNAALGGRTVTRPWNFNELMGFVGWTTGGWWQNNNMTLLAESLLGARQNVSTGSQTKITPTFMASPGSQVERALLWGGADQRVDLEFPGVPQSTIAYFMSEAQRYMDLYKLFASKGASEAAATAKHRAETLMLMLSSYVSDPLVLDLNGNGAIDVTGRSAAKFRLPGNQTFVAEGSVMFDISNSGTPLRTEWIRPGEGFLIDNRGDKARKAVASGKNLTVDHLFGDTEGFAGGFMKLAALFDAEAKLASSGGKIAAKGLGVISGKELDDILVWLDNGDGKAEASELQTMASLGITEIRLPVRFVQNEAQEWLEQATFMRHGKPQLMQEVWFARE
jgi:hypothetical protein